MFRKILFPTDFSECSDKAFDYIMGLKDVGVHKVVIVHVLKAEEEFPVTLTIKDKAKIRFKDMEEALKRHGMDIESTVELGNPASEILKAAAFYNVSMIVMGCHGKGLLEEVMLGSVSDQVVKESKVPVLVVRCKVLEGIKEENVEEYSAESFKRILFPVDFSFCSTRALDFVRRLKDAGSREVMLAHVVDNRYLFPYRAKQAKVEAEKRLEVYRKELEERGMKAKVKVPVGVPLDELIRLADKEDSSLIVMGSHGKSFVREVFLGSVSENMIRQAKIPVLVVHDDVSDWDYDEDKQIKR